MTTAKALAITLRRTEQNSEDRQASRAAKQGNRPRSKQPDTRDLLTCLKLLLAGATSALVSRTVVAPLERVKMELVLNTSHHGALGTALNVYRHEGIRGFWKGNALNVLRTAPFKALNFLCFDLYRNIFSQLAGEETNSQRFAAGAAAGITATLLCFPLDVLRTRLLAPQGSRYGGPLRTLSGIFKHEGRAALYAGVLPAVIAMAPAGAVFYGVYDVLKQRYLAEHMPEGATGDAGGVASGDLPAAYTLMYGAAAGAASEVVVYPLEVIRRRMQLISMQRGAAAATGSLMRAQAVVMAASATAESPAALAVQRLVYATTSIMKVQGVAGLYSGLLPNMLQVLPSAALSYFTYETMKHVLKVNGQ